MRKLVRGYTEDELNKLVKTRESRGWNRISENKFDDSKSSWGIASWVCVMELPDKEGKKRTWGI